MKMVTLNLDGKHPHYVVPEDIWRMNFDSDARADVEIPNPPNSFSQCLSFEPVPLDWRQLLRLKERFGVLTYKGNDVAVLEYLSHPKCSVYEFGWSEHGQRQLDFSDARKLHSLSVEVLSKAFRLTLPLREGLRSLRIVRPPGGCRLTVHAPDLGRGLILTIVEGILPKISGLKQIEGLEFIRASEVDLDAVVRAYPHLEYIRVFGKSVTLAGIASLARLRSLKKMWFNSCYAMNAAEFPELNELPLLEDVNFDGLRVEDAAILKNKYKGVKQLRIAGKRSAEWIANNLDNPFRNWDEDFGRAAGNKAMQAWTTASTELKKLADGNATRAREILKAYVDVFNQMERRSGLETDQRELIYEAFTELASRLPSGIVSDDDYYDWAEYS
ncbi:MAG: hypothetical protein R3C18_08805 [Planctomycetaceae bacterium]